MSWIKISDDNGGTYGLEATPDPREIITVAGLNNEIAELDAQINSLANIPYPDGASAEVKEAIDIYNKGRASERGALESLKQLKEDILSEL